MTEGAGELGIASDHIKENWDSFNWKLKHDDCMNKRLYNKWYYKGKYLWLVINVAHHFQVTEAGQDLLYSQTTAGRPPELQK